MNNLMLLCHSSLSANSDQQNAADSATSPVEIVAADVFEAPSRKPRTAHKKRTGRPILQPPPRPLTCSEEKAHKRRINNRLSAQKMRRHHTLEVEGLRRLRAVLEQENIAYRRRIHSLEFEVTSLRLELGTRTYAGLDHLTPPDNYDTTMPQRWDDFTLTTDAAILAGHLSVPADDSSFLPPSQLYGSVDTLQLLPEALPIL